MDSQIQHLKATYSLSRAEPLRCNISVRSKNHVTHFGLKRFTDALKTRYVVVRTNKGLVCYL